MEKYLAIIEVSQKQAYIFGAKKLKDNVRRSEIIRYVTEELPYVCGATRAKNEVYSGGGNTILQFDSLQEAQEVLSLTSNTAYCGFSGLELFTKVIRTDDDRDMGQEVERLKKALEEKKNLRTSAFRRKSTGLEKLDRKNLTLSPRMVTAVNPPEIPVDQKENAFRRKHPIDFPEVAGKDNFISVVHIDGNNMGAKVQDVSKQARDWQDSCRAHQVFSAYVDNLFQQTLSDTIRYVDDWQDTVDDLKSCSYHVIRPLIAAGDDICFVCSGAIGLDCAAYFLRRLKENSGGEYTACAGVAMVHVKYPFSRAYDLSEDLCSSAKRYAAELRGNGKAEITAMDWHIEFGQGRESISEIREDYITEDSGNGNSADDAVHVLTLRPVALDCPDAGLRDYDFIRRMLASIEGDTVARGKVKQLREYLKQGEAETEAFILFNGLEELSKCAFEVEYENSIAEMLQSNKTEREVNLYRESVENNHYYHRSLYFDAIELMDHMTRMGEEGAK